MILLDAGPLIALSDESDPDFEDARSLIQSHRGSLTIPALVVAEVSFLLTRRIGVHAELGFLADIVDGNFEIEAVARPDWPRIRELVAQYRDFPLGTVDASIIAAAEQTGITTIATFDRRHFSVVRPRHIEAFQLLP